MTEPWPLTLLVTFPFTMKVVMEKSDDFPHEIEAQQAAMLDYLRVVGFDMALPEVMYKQVSTCHLYIVSHMPIFNSNKSSNRNE